jgi:hypothetical protein
MQSPYGPCLTRCCPRANRMPSGPSRAARSPVARLRAAPAQRASRATIEIERGAAAPACTRSKRDAGEGGDSARLGACGAIARSKAFGRSRDTNVTSPTACSPRRPGWSRLKGLASRVTRGPFTRPAQTFLARAPTRAPRGVRDLATRGGRRSAERWPSNAAEPLRGSPREPARDTAALSISRPAVEG